MSNHRQRLAPAVVMISVLMLLSACGGHNGVSAQGGPLPEIAPPPGPVRVEVRTLPGLGPVLVDEQGYTLYLFPPDSHAHVTCTDACQGSWPSLALPAADAPVAGPGVNPALLGAAADPAGLGEQVVTYAGWPLYTYAGDITPGQANGQGLNLNGDSWFVVQPSGKAVVPPAQQDVLPGMSAGGGK